MKALEMFRFLRYKARLSLAVLAGIITSALNFGLNMVTFLFAFIDLMGRMTYHMRSASKNGKDGLSSTGEL